jgi:hypothetical protein
MTTADSSQHSLAYVEESTFGTTPSSPTLTPFRQAGTTGGVTKTLLESQEANSSRDVKFIRHGNKQVGIEVPFELSYGSQDDMLASCLGDSWSTEIDSGALTCDVAPSGSNATFTRDSGSFVSDGFAQYDVITVSGYSDAGGNGRFLVTSVVALTITATPIEGQTVPTESGTGNEQIIKYPTIVNSTGQDSYTFQRNFGDIGDYIVLTGMSVDSINLEIGLDSMVTGTMSLIGKDISTATSAISGSSVSAETTTEAFDTYTGTVYENGATGACFTSLSLNMTNNISRNYCVFSDTVNSLTYGKFRLSGSASMDFQDLTYYNKFIDETVTSASFVLTDPDGNSYWCYIPRMKYTAGNPDTSGEGSVALPLEYQAYNSAAANCTFMMQKVDA